MDVSPEDLQHWQTWVGASHEDEDLLALRHARLMAATLGLDASKWQPGHPLPPLWHWIYFLEGLPATALGRDGHPARGGFLPPVSLPNRMWAGGRVNFPAPLPLGGAARKRSQVLRLQHKAGRSGELVFVTVLHQVFHGDRLCIQEEHDIVYKGALKPAAGNGTAAAEPPAPAVSPDTANPPPPAHQRSWTPDSTQLFRYSALTFNGHRIHYDQDYCRDVEAYANLVVHGPLVATQLAALGQELAGRPLRGFSYRGLQPATLGQTLSLQARHSSEDRVELESVLPNGQTNMQAQAW